MRESENLEEPRGAGTLAPAPAFPGRMRCASRKLFGRTS